MLSRVHLFQKRISCNRIGLEDCKVSWNGIDHLYKCTRMELCNKLFLYSVVYSPYISVGSFSMLNESGDDLPNLYFCSFKWCCFQIVEKGTLVRAFLSKFREFVENRRKCCKWPEIEWQTIWINCNMLAFGRSVH